MKPFFNKGTALTATVTIALISGYWYLTTVGAPAQTIFLGTVILGLVAIDLAMRAKKVVEIKNPILGFVYFPFTYLFSGVIYLLMVLISFPNDGLLNMQNWSLLYTIGVIVASLYIIACLVIAAALLKTYILEFIRAHEKLNKIREIIPMLLVFFIITGFFLFVCALLASDLSKGAQQYDGLCETTATNTGGYKRMSSNQLFVQLDGSIRHVTISAQQKAAITTCPGHIRFLYLPTTGVVLELN